MPAAITPALFVAACTMKFYIYENWQAGPHRAVVHVGSCTFCRDGKGPHNAPDSPNGQCHGPFTTAELARTAAARISGLKEQRDCGICKAGELRR